MGVSTHTTWGIGFIVAKNEMCSVNDLRQEIKNRLKHTGWRIKIINYHIEDEYLYDEYKTHIAVVSENKDERQYDIDFNPSKTEFYEDPEYWTNSKFYMTRIKGNVKYPRPPRAVTDLMADIYCALTSTPATRVSMYPVKVSMISR